MSDYAISLKRTSILLAVIAFSAVIFAANFWSLFSARASAAQLSSRSLTLSSSLAGTEVGDGDPGDPENGSEATHTFQFDVVSGTDIMGMTFEYCDNAINTCLAAGTTGLDDMDTAAVVLGAVEVNGTPTTWTGASAASTAANEANASSATALAVAPGDTVSVALTLIENPTEIDAFFVRITTYSDQAMTTSLDEGTVASAIVDGIAITSRVVETLGFSTVGSASTNALTAEGTACDPLVGSGAITLGDPTEGTLAINTAYDAFSAFRLYTNAANGVVVQYAGQSLTKGSDVIDAIGGTPEISDLGTEQFGLAIDQTANGGSITGADTTFGGVGQLDLDTNYDLGAGDIQEGPSVAEFAFVAGNTPQTIATSAANDFYVSCDTAVVRYLGNIAASTPAGTYTTTVVYYAVPTY